MRLNVVSFQCPLPANYGGAVDVWHKLRALHDEGARLTLHTFIYGSRRPDDRLLEVCDRVYYYPRLTGMRSQLSLTPYIVGSRRNSELLARLTADDAPVLLEGLHTCALLRPLRRAGKRVAVRVHNVEHDYYSGLARKAADLRERIYFSVEAARLRRYEKVLADADILFTISDADTRHCAARFPGVRVVHIPPFFDTPDDSLTTDGAPDGPALLYHGNMTVGENIEAARFLLTRVLPLTATHPRLTVAGHNPPASLADLGAEIVDSPSDEELRRLVSGAAVNILVTDQPTGMKLKLMKVLAEARGHCLVNPPMLTDPFLLPFCQVADSPEALAAAVDRLLATPRDQAEADRSRRRFLELYGPATSARRLLKELLS